MSDDEKTAELHQIITDVVREWREARQHPMAEWEPVGKDLARVLDELERRWKP